MSSPGWHILVGPVPCGIATGYAGPTSPWPTAPASSRALPTVSLPAACSASRPQMPCLAIHSVCRSPNVSPRFTYSSYRPYAKRIRELQRGNAAEREAAGVRLEDPPLSLPATVPNLDPSADDAFGTVMAWLYHRIPHTR